ncbi:ABC transporter permease [Polycladomyces sp. WAk]|uniref:ABC transporter permease n=1 Tax=Polycladomyces zharkentensis TaxID=2807616 RepID=A0ABS2WEH8_9BACL|nr:ABC transporter permease subunit [Polycladomyces sp. WAk]MBN2907959.1 ABC transporter permease [Polycladomyces sp. WAk]
MIRLWISEWERLWSRRITWILFFSIPLVLWVTGKYYLGKNAHLSPSSPEFTVMDNFPTMALAEQLITFFNVVVLMLLVFSITEEYGTGQLRLIILRACSFRQIFFAKWLAVMGTVGLFQVAYFLESYLIGAWMFPFTGRTRLFLHAGWASSGQAFSYHIRYYLIAFATLVVISAVMMFFAVISSTTTTAMGLSVGFLMISIAYPYVLFVFTRGLNPPLSPKWFFLSLTHIQYQGIARMLAEKPDFVGWNFAIMAVYGVFFTVMAYGIFTRQDRFF